ncbi:MAG: TonB-dependent receptor, partial [Niabella sp.]|nr:TonB-dependent receptor [Niabella sp.]
VIRGQEQMVTIVANDKPLKELLHEVEQQSRYTILYSDDIIPDSLKITIALPKMTVSKALDTILASKGLFFSPQSQGMIVVGSTALKAADSLRGEKNAGISGTISDEEGHRVAFATVSLFAGDSMLRMTSCDEQGLFRLSDAFSNDSTYRLRISAIGYEAKPVVFVFPDTAILAGIQLSHNKSLLSAVTVTTRKPFVERLVDRLVVNVDQSPLENAGTALDVLQRAPGVMVDYNGIVRFNGNTVRIMINGVQQRMSPSDLVNFLRGLRSEDVKKLEIIPTPPGEYEASGIGGIINIELKRSVKDGYKLTPSVIYRQQNNKPYYTPALTIMAKQGRLNIYGNVNYTSDKSSYISDTKNYYSDGGILDQIGARDNDNRSRNYMLGLVYELSDRQTVSGQVINAGTKNNQFFDTKLNFERPAGPFDGHSVAHRLTNYRNTGATVNYQLKLDTTGSEFKLAADYYTSNNWENNQYNSVYNESSRNTGYQNFTPGLTTMYSGGADVLKRVGRTFKFRTGLKINNTARDNTLLTQRIANGAWRTDSANSNRFLYKEAIYMGYITGETRIINTGVKLGLRAENTKMEGNSVTQHQEFSRNYLNLFPSVFINQAIGKKKTDAVYFSYARRIERPGFKELNPYTIYFGDFSILRGNPDLLPQFSHNFRLGYTFLKGFSLDFDYNKIRNGIAPISDPLPGNIIETEPRNLSSTGNYGLSLYAPVKPFKWWDVNFYGRVYHQSYALPDGALKKNSWFVNCVQTFRIPKNWEVALFFNYQAPYINGNEQWAPLFFSYCAITKKMCNEKLRLRLSLEDILNSYREKYTIDYKNTIQDFYQKRPTRVASLYVSYNFSWGKKVKENQIERSNDEERKRL